MEFCAHTADGQRAGGGHLQEGGQQQELSSRPGGSRGGSRERGKEPLRGQLGWGAVAQLQGRLQKERKKGRREGGFLWRRHRRTAIGEAPRDRRGGARRSGRGVRLEEARAAALGQAWEGPGEGGKQRKRVTWRRKEGERKGSGGAGGRGWAFPEETPGDRRLGGERRARAWGLLGWAQGGWARPEGVWVAEIGQEYSPGKRPATTAHRNRAEAKGHCPVTRHRRPHAGVPAAVRRHASRRACAGHARQAGRAAGPERA